jgi:hypothetical protein
MFSNPPHFSGIYKIVSRISDNNGSRVMKHLTQVLSHKVDVSGNELSYLIYKLRQCPACAFFPQYNLLLVVLFRI